MENLTANITSHPAFEATTRYAADILDALQILPKSTFVLGSVALGWYLNRWANDRALNNNNAPAQFDWEKEIIVVTGGSGGIGAEIVKSLAAREITVIVLDVLPLTYPKGAKTHYYKCDLTDFDELQSIAARIRKDVGEPTVAIANAGICRGKPILAASKKDIELTFGVNNLALLWTAKTFLPSMVDKNHGHFLIVASSTGYTSTPGVTDYSATKSAAIAIYEGLHGEIRRIHNAHSVRVSCVSPGSVDTKMFSGINLGPGIATMKPETLGKNIADIVYSGRAKNVFIPASTGLVVWARAMPDWVRVALQGFSTGIFAQLKPHNPMEGK